MSGRASSNRPDDRTPDDASPDDAPPSDHTREDEGWLSLRRLARTWPRAIVTVWVALTVVLLGRVLGDPGVEISGDPEALVPPEHRTPEGEPLLLLTVQEDALGEDDSGTDRLIAAAAAVAEQLGERRVPLGPPAAELTAWLDSHALYLLPVSAHEALAQRLTDAAMAEAVDALRARLSSPLYGVSGEEPRRDPLRLQELSRGHAGRLTHLGNAEDMPAELTPAGDLLALDGRRLLIQLRSEQAPEALLHEVRNALPDSTVEAALVGPGARKARQKAAIVAGWDRLVMLGFGGLVVVMSLAMRAVRPVLAIVLVLGSALAGILALGPAVGPYDVPMLMLLVGFGCEGALHLTRISARGWPAAAVLGGALLPLSLSPYPAWQRWSIEWLAGVAGVVILLRLVVPALLRLARYDTAPARRGFVLHPLRGLAVVLAVGALAGGAWSVGRLPFLALDRAPAGGQRGAEGEAAEATTATTATKAADEAERIVREAFFDPRLVVRATSSGETPAAALEQAAEHARQLATLVPDDATRVDSPGRLVLPPGELRSRQRSLAKLEIDERMAALHEQLETRGFRADAFGEFLRGAADLEDLPTPQAALDGPMGAWIGRYLSQDGTTLVTEVHLHADGEAPVPRIETESGDTLVLHGPAVAARRDRQGFADWLGIYVVCQLWLGALAVWLGTRSLAAALGCACAALTAQTAVLAVMVALKLPLGPAVIPALLLVGAAAMVAGGRACQSVRTGVRFYATGVLLSGLCQAVAGVALFASGEGLWSYVGLVVAVGAVVASGAGLFVAPGMMRVFGMEESGENGKVVARSGKGSAREGQGDGLAGDSPEDRDLQTNDDLPLEDSPTDDPHPIDAATDDPHAEDSSIASRTSASRVEFPSNGANSADSQDEDL